MGFTERDVLIIKTDFNGDTVWTKTIGGLYNDWGLGMDKTTDDGLIITGQFDRYGDDNNDVWLIRLDKLITGLGEETSPFSYFLYQNFPNPFNPTTKIKFTIPSVGAYRNTPLLLKVYDVLGNEVKTLINREMPAGVYEVEFSAIGGSASGGDAHTLPSGIYFYTLSAGNFVETKKMLMIK